MSDTAVTAMHEQFLAEVAGADWHDIPRGHYAIPEIADDLDGDNPDFCQALGWRLFERRVPRVLRNGKKSGPDQWRIGAAWLAEGVAAERFTEYMSAKSVDPEWDSRYDIVTIIDQPDAYRQIFGQITGRCGYCGRALTDSESKMRGIGPDCFGITGSTA